MSELCPVCELPLDRKGPRDCDSCAPANVRDLVLCWTGSLDGLEPGMALVRDEKGEPATFDSPPPFALVCITKNAEDQLVTIAGPVVLRGVQGERILEKLGPGVWKPTIGFAVPFKAHVTIVGVPDPAPWEKP